MRLKTEPYNYRIGFSVYVHISKTVIFHIYRYKDITYDLIFFNGEEKRQLIS